VATSYTQCRRDGRDVTFAVDQNDVIWYDATGAAPEPPFSETSALKRLQVLPK